MTNIGYRTPCPCEPYAGLPDYPNSLTSTDIQDGGTAPEWMRSALSALLAVRTVPAAVLERIPRGRQSFVLTCFDRCACPQWLLALDCLQHSRQRDQY